MLCTTAVNVVLASLLCAPAPQATPPNRDPAMPTLATVETAGATTTALRAADVDQPLPTVGLGGATRPGILPALYGSFVGLQAYDAYATTKGVKQGATEVNPVMHGAAGDPVAIWAIKSGATIASIYAAERLWRRHRPVEAIATMVALNGIAVVVAAHNASIIRAQR